MSNLNDGSFYEAREIIKVGSILGIEASNLKMQNNLQNALEKAAFYFTLSMEKRTEQITPSEGARKMKRLRKKANSLHKELLNLDRPILGSLLNVRFSKALDEINWLASWVGQLETDLEREIAPAGGKRNDQARHLFFDLLHEIVLEFHKSDLPAHTDRVTGKKAGALVDFLEIVKKPLNSPSDASTIADAYLDHIKGGNVVD